eukprot:scaffold2910_cov112-Isochrysis_galbana.AAC.4
MWVSPVPVAVSLVFSCGQRSFRHPRGAVDPEPAATAVGGASATAGTAWALSDLVAGKPAAPSASMAARSSPTSRRTPATSRRTPLALF